MSVKSVLNSRGDYAKPWLCTMAPYAKYFLFRNSFFFPGNVKQCLSTPVWHVYKNQLKSLPASINSSFSLFYIDFLCVLVILLTHARGEKNQETEENSNMWLNSAIHQWASSEKVMKGIRIEGKWQEMRQIERKSLSDEIG